MLLFPICAGFCALLCMLLHYEFLRLISCAAARLTIAPRRRILCVVAGALGSHVSQIMIFALALWVLARLLGLAAFNPGKDASLLRAVCISFESYAALGGTESFAYVPLRLFAGLEGLSGLVLIGWTSAFTYWCMTRYWDEHL